MGKYSGKQQEQISIAAINNMLLLATKRRVQTYISDNDKEPMWDGHIYVYKNEGSEKKEDYITRIPVQVKSKVVSKLSKKFVSYPIDRNCLEGYLKDGGVIYFVVEIKDNGDIMPETKIFYKELIPSDLKSILEEIPDTNKSKTVHIDRILTPKDNFLRICSYFDEARKILSVDSINNMIPLEKVLDKEIKILTANGIEDILNGQCLAYCINEHNIKMPIKINADFTQISFQESHVIKIDDHRCFDNCTRHKNSKGEEYVTFGDTIKIMSNGNLTIKSSTSHVIERDKTLDYLLNRLIDSKAKFNKEEENLIQTLKNEKGFLNDILEVCKRFNIDATTVRLKEFKERDFKAVSILLNVRKYDGMIDGAKSIECAVVRLLNYEIALLKVVFEDNIKYYDFYDNKINLLIIAEHEGRKAEFSRFAIINENLLVCHNFNSDLVKETLLPIKNESGDIVSEYYNKLMLFLIKAWDINNNANYINLIRHLECILEGYIEREIEIINKAQVEYRLNNGRLNHKTLDELYKIKFNESLKNDIKCAICILLQDYEGFDEKFSLLTQKEKEVFVEYPIYSLYKEYKDKCFRE